MALWKQGMGFACVSVLLAACGQNHSATSASTPASEASKAEAASGKVLTVGSDMTFPPYEYMENNEPKGVDIELMNAIAKNIGYSVKWEDTRWANLIPGLDGKKFDVLFSSMYITKERLQKVDMIPYYKTDESLLVTADATFAPKGPGDLCGHTVGTMKGTAFVTQLQTVSKETCVAAGKGAITIREYETSPQVTQAVLAKAVEVQYDDAAVMKAAVKKLGDKVKITSTESFFPVVGGIAIRKGDSDMRQKLEDGLKKAEASGEYKALLDQYGLSIPTQADIDAVMK